MYRLIFTSLMVLLLWPCGVKADELAETAEVILRDQEAWLKAVENTKKISIGKSSRRSKKKQRAVNQQKIDHLLIQLTAVRKSYRTIVRDQLFDNDQTSRSFEIISKNGIFFCFSTQQGQTGFCTQENTNRTFTW